MRGRLNRVVAIIGSWRGVSSEGLCFGLNRKMVALFCGLVRRYGCVWLSVRSRLQMSMRVAVVRFCRKVVVRGGRFGVPLAAVNF